MGKLRPNNRKWNSLVDVLAFILQFYMLFVLVACSETTTPNRKHKQGKKFNISGLDTEFTMMTIGIELRDAHPYRMVVNNGIVQVNLSIPEGEVTGIKYGGIANLLEIKNYKTNRGYWDVVWFEPGDTKSIDRITGTNFSVIMQNEEQIEISFTRKWNFKHRGSLVPLNIDRRYVLRRGISGLYMYAILEREKGWPDVEMDDIRAVFKIRKDKFHYMALSDKRQRVMPMPEDRTTGQPLAYPEAVRLTNPINPKLKGEVDDKYQYSEENQNNKVHGWISTEPPVGFWMITPSSEFRSCGPNKQELTSHAGPIVLSVYNSVHYAGKDLNNIFKKEEPWKKVFGPVLVYLNSINSSKEDPITTLWQDAKKRALLEVKKWPYDFPQSKDFLKADKRGSVSGQLFVRDRYVNECLMKAQSAYVGLAAPGEAGSWQREVKGYQFWTQADEEGNFTIKNVRKGNYSLYAWVPGFIGDYKYEHHITIKPGSEIKLDAIVYEPPRNGSTLWEIGIPDRSAAEFYVPEPYPTLVNPLYTNDHDDRFRQYGLWDRYEDLYPHHDLKYTIGVSNYTQDWFYAQVNRKKGNNTYKATTWQIIFPLDNVKNKGNYTLQLALASITGIQLEVRFNNDSFTDLPPFATPGVTGKDNAMARHGIHGLYWLYSIDVPSYKLQKGNNTIHLTQARNKGPFQEIMYDYIRLEAPPKHKDD